MKNNKYGFTLIELLVVIAIIAILAAILFPVFAKVREKARQTACLSNEKQLGLGFLQYSEDYDEAEPAGYWFADGQGWAGELYSYVKSTKVYTCPDDSITPTTVSFQGPYYVVSYGYNRNMVTKPTTDGTTTTSGVATIAMLQSPASTVLLHEIVNNVAKVDNNNGHLDQDSATDFGSYGFDGFGPVSTINGGHPLTDTGYMGNPAANVSYQPTGRHTNGSNFVLADGHAKWLRGTAVSPGLSAEVTTDAQGVHNVKYGGEGPFPTAVGTGALGSFAATFSTN